MKLVGGQMKLRDMTNPEGVVVKSNGKYDYRYFMRDYLGNVRYVSGIYQYNDYDPLGKIIYSSNLDKNVYLYEGKERIPDIAEEYKSVYDFGARYYNPLYGRWFAPDPAKQGINPYVYCGNNPVQLVDPDGNDYYQAASGALVWRNMSKQSITINKEIFNNIGRSYSAKLIDDTYANFYQDVLISTSKSPIDAEKTILNNEDLLGELLSKNSPLTKESQSELMIASIHDGQNNFIRGSAESASVITQYVGMATSIAGYVISATGVGLGAGLAISELGNGISKIGTGITALTNLSDGDYTKMGVTAGSYLIGQGVDKLAKYGAMGAEAVRGGVNLFFTPLQMMVGNIRYQNNQNQ